MDKTTIILTTYNRAAILPRCLNSILDQEYTNWELLVIDDHSQDDTEKVVRTFLHDDRIHYIKNNSNLGMTRSRNKGLESCNTNLVFIGEDDVILDRECLEALVRTFMELKRENSTLFHVSPKLVISEDCWIKRAEKSTFRSEFKINTLTGFLYNKWGNVFGETPFLPSIGLYDCDLLRRVGFSEDYIGKPLLHEDTDLHFRARNCGLRFFYEPEALAYHLHYARGGERSFNLLKQQYFRLRNHFHFIVKFFKLRSLYMGLIFAVTHLLYPLEFITTTTLSSFFLKDIEEVLPLSKDLRIANN